MPMAIRWQFGRLTMLSPSNFLMSAVGTEHMLAARAHVVSTRVDRPVRTVAAVHHGLTTGLVGLVRRHIECLGNYGMSCLSLVVGGKSQWSYVQNNSWQESRWEIWGEWWMFNTKNRSLGEQPFYRNLYKNRARNWATK